MHKNRRKNDPLVNAELSARSRYYLASLIMSATLLYLPSFIALALSARPHDGAKYPVRFLSYAFFSRRLIVIVWRPLKHISAPSSKTVGDRENSFGVTCHLPRELPFGDVATAQWFTTRPVEVRVCMYPTIDHQF